MNGKLKKKEKHEQTVTSDWSNEGLIASCIMQRVI